MVYAHTTTYTHTLYTHRCAYNKYLYTTLYQSIHMRLQYIYCRYLYVYRIIICVCFRSGDEFLRDVRPYRTNRAFLILLLLFYARALHILCLNYTAVGRARCGPALPSVKTYDRSTIFSLYNRILVHYICVMMVPERCRVRKSKQYVYIILL